MAHKVIIVADPGIDGAFAIALALHDPDLDVLCLAATAGNIPAEQATQNVHILVQQLDPPRWPRFGSALPAGYEIDGRQLHGAGGFGGLTFPSAELHHVHPSEKLIADLVRQHPKYVAILLLGPATTLARAIDRDPELPSLIQRIVFVGGAWREQGDASAVAEFHLYCDPAAARQVLRCGTPVTLIPLDVSRKLIFSPTDLLELPDSFSRTGEFLRRILPHGIGATSSLYGVEGFHLKDVLGVVAQVLPSALTTRPMYVDVETRGELTRGMSVVDARWSCPSKPNVELAAGVDVNAVRQYMKRVLERAM